MPCYTFACKRCQEKFEICTSIAEYTDQQKCVYCKQKDQVERCYVDDIGSLNTSIKKSDSELKTIGDIANRNRDRMSEDEKKSLYKKHNDYKDDQPKKELPKGFTRMEKQPKTKWY